MREIFAEQGLLRLPADSLDAALAKAGKKVDLVVSLLVPDELKRGAGDSPLRLGRLVQPFEQLEPLHGTRRIVRTE